MHFDQIELVSTCERPVLLHRIYDFVLRMLLVSADNFSVRTAQWLTIAPACVSVSPGLGSMATGKELSGPVWIDRFPTSRTTDSLADGFRQKCDSFLKALKDAGASVDIAATRRPPERAYIMHWCFLINAGQVDPEDVPPHAGVNIEWMHRKPNGSPDPAASRAAAAAMVQGYDIAFQPSLASQHTFGKAIDMSIGWDGALTIKQKSGANKRITSLPRSGLNHGLWEVGAGYGVIKLPSDRPHWSSNGH